MFNQRRKHSAYLEYSDGKIKSTEPNSPKEKVQTIINSHKKEKNLTAKDLIGFLLFITITIIFIYFSSFFIKYISINMNTTTSNFKISKNISKTTSSINIKENKKNTEIIDNMTLLTNSVNNYNSEISSIYSSLKGYISIYYKGKEGIYMTQRSLTAMIDRIDLDLSIVKKDKSLQNNKNLKQLYIDRFDNIKNYLTVNIVDKETALNDLNNIIKNENNLSINCKEETKNILEKNNIVFSIVNNNFEIQK